MTSLLRGYLDRPLSGVRYFFIGFGTFIVKFTLDSLLAHHVFHRQWLITDYWTGSNAFYLAGLAKQDAVFFAAMLALALPFILIGVLMTHRRLNTLDLQPWLVALFFIPYVNLALFAILVVTRSPGPTHPAQSPVQPLKTHVGFGRYIPESVIGSSLLAIAVTGLVSLAIAGFDLMVLKNYGWGLFVFMPFLLGMGSAWLYGYHKPRELDDCLYLAVFSSVILGISLLLCAMEGAICILMAAPLWLTLAGIGGWIGYEIQTARWHRPSTALLLLCLVISLPILMGAEYAAKRTAPLLEVRSSINVHASREQVWRHVISFTELPPPKEWIFHTGLAYPIRARIRGSGAGAVRRCEFSTGAFIEPIRVWQEPSLLRFAVTENPPPMREMSIYSQIDPPHLHGFLVSRQGQFLLTELPDGSTKLEGTTWYEHHLWPARYWQLWSDYIIHRIHLRVLQHIKTLAESEAQKEMTHG